MSKLLRVSGLMVGLAVAANAQPVVPGVAVLAGHDREAAGRVLVAELNCSACHKPGEASAQLLQRRAPKLNGVMDRLKSDYVRRFLADPQGVKPGTLMPKLFDPEDADKIEAIVAYLGSAVGEALPQPRPQRAAARVGFETFSKSGCVACHAPRNKKAKELPLADGKVSVPLGDLGAKYTYAGLSAFLKDPLKVRPSGRMPSFRFDDRTAATVAYFLMGDPKLEVASDEGAEGTAPKEDGTVVSYKLVKTDKGELPKDFSKDAKTGTLGGIMLRNEWSGDGFAVEYETWFYAEKKGTYTFYTKSDDDSFLYVNGKKVVDNGGVHAAQEKKGSLNLDRGHHRLRALYNERRGQQSMAAYVSGPGLRKQHLPERLLSLDKKVPPVEPEDAAPEDDQPAPPEPELIAKGKLLYQQMGCAACHDLREEKQRVRSELQAPPLAKLSTGGCLDAAPNVPQFSLSAEQKSLLAVGLKSLASAKAPDAKKVVSHRFAAMNCYACHERDGIGGPVAARASLFLSKEDDMGPEGHLPPGLSGVGAKLKSSALAKVLTDNRWKDEDWPRHDYLEVKMPYFGKRNVEHLLRDLPAVDGAVKEEEDGSGDLAAGKLLVGNTGLGCVTCHQYNGHKALGIQGLDLTNMTNRVSQSWFRKWLLAPQEIRESTRMPSFWPGGVAANKAVLEGDTDRQIAAIWAFLKAKPEGRPPAGIKIKNLMLVDPTDKPTIYRNFFAAAGSRGIGVTYPEGVNILFDANYNRLLQLWRGDFVNAGVHWVGRGQGVVKPFGGQVAELFRADPVAFLKEGEAWPERQEHKGDLPGRKADMRFRGYELNDKGQPTFRYSKGEVSISEFYEPLKVGDKVFLKRTIRLRSDKPLDGLHWFVGRGRVVEAIDGGWRVDETRLMISGEGLGQVRKMANDDGFDAVLPLVPGRREATIEQVIQW